MGPRAPARGGEERQQAVERRAAVAVLRHPGDRDGPGACGGQAGVQACVGHVGPDYQQPPVGRQEAGEGGDQAHTVIAERHQDQRRRRERGEGARAGLGRLHRGAGQPHAAERGSLQDEDGPADGSGRPARQRADRAGEQQRHPGCREAQVAEFDRAGLEDASEEQQPGGRRGGERHQQRAQPGGREPPPAQGDQAGAAQDDGAESRGQCGVERRRQVERQSAEQRPALGPREPVQCRTPGEGRELAGAAVTLGEEEPGGQGEAGGDAGEQPDGGRPRLRPPPRAAFGGEAQRLPSDRGRRDEARKIVRQHRCPEQEPGQPPPGETAVRAERSRRSAPRPRPAAGPGMRRNHGRPRRDRRIRNSRGSAGRPESAAPRCVPRSARGKRGRRGCTRPRRGAARTVSPRTALAMRRRARNRAAGGRRSRAGRGRAPEGPSGLPARPPPRRQGTGGRAKWDAAIRR